MNSNLKNFSIFVNVNNKDLEPYSEGDWTGDNMEPFNLKDSWTSKNKWILWLKNQGLKPEMEILDVKYDQKNNLDPFEIKQYDDKQNLIKTY